MVIGLAVDQEQNTGNQCTDSRNDIKDRTKAQAKKHQAFDDQKDSEQDPFNFFHVHVILSFLLLRMGLPLTKIATLVLLLDFSPFVRVEYAIIKGRS
jgi:hypothetical protein